MATIPGASQYLGAATLANQRGIPAQTASLLDDFSSSILDVGRRLTGNNGIGISGAARALNNKFLNRASEINQLLSLTIGPDATPEGASQQILALRAGLSTSELSPDLQNRRALELAGDDGTAAASETGQALDTEA